MHPIDIHVLTNDYQRFRLVSLRLWSGAAEFAERDHAGPYILSQTASLPGDPAMVPEEFLLGRSGQWVRTAGFFRLVPEVRRALFIYSTVAELMSVLRSLPAEAAVMELEPRQLGAPATDRACEELRSIFSEVPREALPLDPPQPKPGPEPTSQP